MVYKEQHSYMDPSVTIQAAAELLASMVSMYNPYANITKVRQRGPMRGPNRSFGESDDPSLENFMNPVTASMSLEDRQQRRRERARHGLRSPIFTEPREGDTEVDAHAPAPQVGTRIRPRDGDNEVDAAPSKRQRIYSGIKTGIKTGLLVAAAGTVAAGVAQVVIVGGPLFFS